MRKSKVRKIVASILLGVVSVTAIPTMAMAEILPVAEDSPQALINQPRLTYIVDAQTDLMVRNGTATVDCWVKGSISSATKAKAIVELQVKNSPTNWIPVAIWTDTQNDFMAAVYETKEINSNNTYRVKATYTVWEGSQSETITVYSD